MVGGHGDNRVVASRGEGLDLLLVEALLQDATTQETPYADFLDLVLTEEVTSKTAKHVTMRTRLARFPFVKSLETFDFSSLR